MSASTTPPAADLKSMYPRFPTDHSSDELTAATTAWFKAHRPEVLGSEDQAFRERGWLIVWTPPYCPKSQPIELVWGAGKQRASGMAFPNRDLATTRLHLRISPFGGKDSQGAAWGPVNLTGCWTRAELEMNKWIAVDKGHVGGSLANSKLELIQAHMAQQPTLRV